MTHIIGLSAVLFGMYPAGNPLVNGTNGDYYLSTPKLQA
jgi:hypothetical protein